MIIDAIASATRAPRSRRTRGSVCHRRPPKSAAKRKGNKLSSTRRKARLGVAAANLRMKQPSLTAVMGYLLRASSQSALDPQAVPSTPFQMTTVAWSTEQNSLHQLRSHVKIARCCPQCRLTMVYQTPWMSTSGQANLSSVRRHQWLTLSTKRTGHSCPLHDTSRTMQVRTN